MNSYDENLCRARNIIRNKDKVFRIPGVGIDLSLYNTEDCAQIKQEVAKELSIREDKKIVLCVARLIPAKGVLVLLEAAREISKQRGDICF